PRWVEVTAKPDIDDCWQILVRDNGIGIPAHALRTVFQRFTRAHTDREDLHVGGIGLGLSIVEDCVRGFGGEISVESTEGVGTTFMLKLPATPHASSTS